jgi:putative hydroxymethylpyrimidine transport system substrate-binding protein
VIALKTFSTAALICVVGLTAAGCGQRTEPTAPQSFDSLRVTLDRAPNASQACFFAAQSAGSFKAVGLDVSLVSPPSTGQALDDLTAERSDVALASQPLLATKRSQGAALVSIATALREPIWKISPPVAATKATKKGAKPQVKPVAHPWTGDGLPAGSKSVPAYPGMLVVARRTDLGQKGSLVRRFVQALSRGCAAVTANSGPAIKEIAASPGGQSAGAASKELAKYLPQFQAPAGKPWGWQDPASWAVTVQWMSAHHLLSSSSDPDPGYTNEFLAGQGA